MKKIIFLIILIILLITPSVFADENSDTEPEIIINKIEKSSQSRSNIQGLDLLSGDPENNPENYFLFESKGTKKKTIKLEDLNKNKQENLDLPQDAVIKLDTLQVDAKDAGIFDKIINVFDKEEQEQKSANLEIDISNQGKLNVKNTENITEQNQDEKIEIKYEYGEYKKAYQAEEVYLNIPELNFIDVDEKNINSLLEEIDDIELIDFFAEEIEIENATTTPEPEPVLEEEPIQIQEPIQNATSTDNATSTSLIAPKIFSQKPLKNYSFFDLLAGLIKPEQNKKGTKSYQIKMRSSTDTGNQTFQIIPDGSVYLYDGTELIAKAKPRFQYKSAGDWKNFEIEKIKIAKRLTNNLLTVLIKQETTTKNAIILKYEIGFNNNQFLKKQTWQINAPYKVRAVWEINTLPSSNSLDAKSKILQVNNLIIDASDYQGNTKISKETERAYVIFEPDGIRGPLTIDPSFSLVTTTDFVEIQTPDFQDQESDSGWRLRFSKLLGGTIDEFYHNKIQDGAINLINSSSSLPLFNISYQGDSLALNNAQLEILESSATRIRVKSTGSVNNDPVEIIYTVYLSGKINIESSINLQNISLHNRDGIFRFNLCHDQVSCSRQADDQNKLGLININNTLKTGLGVNQNGWIGDVDFTSNGLEFGASSAGVWAKGYTVTTNWLLDLDVVGALHATPLQEMQNIIQDFRNPDTLDFTIGQDQNGYHLTDGAYWMRAENNLAEFTMHGAEVNRYNPVFRLSNWTNGTLAAVYSELAGEEIVQDIDYILSFQDNDPDTQVLIFQFLGILEEDLVFYIDPLCTSTDDGDWSDASKWDCVSAPGSGDQALIQHAITIDASVTVQDITINTGGKLDFDTSGDGFILQINESDVDAKLTVGAADSAGELECRSPATADHTHTIKLNSVTAAASVGIEVLSQGNLDIQGSSTDDQDCIITYGGTSNGYIYLLDGSLTTIKYAEISYMGTGVTNKRGIEALSVDGNADDEGLFIEGSKIHHSYMGVYLRSSNYAIVRNNEIYSIANGYGAIYVSGGSYNIIAGNSLHDNSICSIYITNNTAANNTVIGNVISSNSSIGILIDQSNNYIYNNTINSNTTGIFVNLVGTSGTIIKNNIISNNTTGITDNGTSTVIEYNLFDGNTANGAIGDPAITDQTVTYVNSTGGNIDFLYLDSDETTGAGPLGAGATLWWPAAGATSVPGTINVGGRLGYVKNTTDDEEFNWLQDAHDDATSDVLSAGDTVTAYANDYFSDTISGSLATVGSYMVSFAITDASDNLDADNEYEGVYAYFTSGANRGRYYLITNSVSASNTLTLYTPDGNANNGGFNTGDGFTVVDRVYARDSGRSGGSENLYLTKDGTATAPITWDTSGTVIVDAEDARNHAIGGYEHRYNIIDSFIVQNGLANGISGSDTAKIVNNTACFNGSGTGYQGGIYASSGNYVAVIQNNTSFSNNGYGISFTNYNRYVLDNTCYDNTTAGIYARSDWNVIKDNSTFSNGIGIRGYESDYDTVIGNRIFSNTGNGISLSTSRLYI